MSQAFTINTGLTKEEAVAGLDAATQALIVAGASATVSVKAALVGFTKATLVSGPGPDENLPVLTLVVTGDEVEHIAALLQEALPGNPKPACPVYGVQEAATAAPAEVEPEVNPSDVPPTTPPPAAAGAPEAK